MEKSADAYRTISEVAEDLVLPQHVLRFWETRFPQIRPLKRAGGRRYYRPADIAMLRAIRQLLYDEGYTIKGVQRLLKEQTGRGFRNGDGSLGPTAQVALLVESGDHARDDHPDETVESAPVPAGGSAADLREALALVEDCERILAALHRPA